MMFVDDTIDLAQVLFLKCTLLFSFVRIFRSKKTLLYSPMAAVGGIYKTSAVCLVEFSGRTVTKSLKGAVAYRHVYSQQ